MSQRPTLHVMVVTAQHTVFDGEADHAGTTPLGLRTEVLFAL